MKLHPKSVCVPRALWLALFGFAFVILIGPVLAVASVVLTFAILGLMGWGAYRAALLVAWWRTPRPLPPPVLPQPPKVQPLPPCERPRSSGVAVLLYEVVCGALVGAMLGLFATWRQPGTWLAAGLGAAVGAGLGLVAGRVRVARAWVEPAP